MQCPNLEGHVEPRWRKTPIGSMISQYKGTATTKRATAPIGARFSEYRKVTKTKRKPLTSLRPTVPSVTAPSPSTALVPSTPPPGMTQPGYVFPDVTRGVSGEEEGTGGGFVMPLLIAGGVLALVMFLK